MGIGMLGAANDMMASMMQTLMKGMEQSAELSTDMIAIGVENRVAGTKMEIAQEIVTANGGIDVYA